MTEVPKDPSRAVDFIIEHAPLHAQAKAERVYIEEFRKSKKALLMAQSLAKSVAAQEVDAYASPFYRELLDGLKAAVEKEETLRWLLIAAQLRVEVYRTMSANNRGQDRATQ